MYKINPAYRWAAEHTQDFWDEFIIGIEGSGASVLKEKVNPDNIKESQFYIERIIKSMLWIYGGYKLYLKGDSRIIQYIKKLYSKDGSRAFDANFMENVYLRPFEIIEGEIAPRSSPTAISSNPNSGKRVGLDLGGTSIKYSALSDGEVIFSGSLDWSPVTQTSSDYHSRMIRRAYDECSSHLDYVDSLGISTAGIVADNKLRVSSLFRNTTDKDYSGYYALNDNYVIINDGDAAVLGSMTDQIRSCTLGIAIGTSEAGGYVDEKGNVTGFLNELAFVPIDFGEDGFIDSWSGDTGCGVSFLSQEGVLNLCEQYGIKFPDDMALPKRCLYVEELWASGDEKAVHVFDTIGTQLGYAIKWYEKFYKINEAVIFGGVMSGAAGDRAIEKAAEIFPNIKKGKNSRYAQSIAAAKLYADSI